MRRLLAWLGPVFRRPRRLPIVLGSCAIVLAALSPFLLASYHWYAGQTALKRYHQTEALDHLNACLRIWPWSRSVHVHLLAARAARREGDFEEATQHIHECQDRLGDTSPDTVFEWSMLHASAGDLDKVEGYLQDDARKNPEHVPLILEALAEGYMRVARIAEAIHCVDEWLAREPDNVQALYLRGSIGRQTGSSQNSVADFRRVIELDPERHRARRLLAIALTDIGRYEEAAQHLELLRQRQPDDIELLVRLAICRYRLGRGPEARVLLDIVLSQQPDHGLALLTRGQMAQLAGRLVDAEKSLRRAIRIMPYDYKARWSLVECLRQEGKTEEAEAERIGAERLRDRWSRLSEITATRMSQQRDDPALQCELGTLLVSLGVTEIGKGWLLSALRLDEHYTPALTALADYYQQRGDAETAEQYRLQAQQSERDSLQQRNDNKPAPASK